MMGGKGVGVGEALICGFWSWCSVWHFTGVVGR